MAPAGPRGATGRGMPEWCWHTTKTGACDHLVQGSRRTCARPNRSPRSTPSSFGRRRNRRSISYNLGIASRCATGAHSPSGLKTPCIWGAPSSHSLLGCMIARAHQGPFRCSSHGSCPFGYASTHARGTIGHLLLGDVPASKAERTPHAHLFEELAQVAQDVQHTHSYTEHGASPKHQCTHNTQTNRLGSG